MTLANMESNKSQRENHLDDLENAFLDEAPLADSVSSVSSPVQLVQKDTIDNDSSTELSEEEDIKLKSSDDLEGPTPFQPLIPHPDKASNYSTNQTHQPLLQKSEDSSQDDFAHSNMDRISNTDSAGGHVTSIHFHEPDVTELRMNDTPLHQPFDTQLNANKRASFAMEDEEYEIHNNDRPLNNDSLFNNEPQESYNQRASRRMIFVGIVLTLAVAGLAVGLISPGQGTRICGDGENATLTNCTIADIIDPEPTPTIPSQPTPAPTFPSRPLWTKAKNILIENSVVREEELRGDSLLPPDQTLQEKVLNILVFQDEIFISYLSTYSNEPSLISTIQIIQRYVLTLFGVSMNYGNWKNNQGWVATDQSECDWYGVLCENKPWNRTGQFTVMPTVTSVSLNKNGLRGNFPRELMNLTKLENLELWVNDLSGTIPDEIGLLTSLKRLWIHETKNMSGTIPSTFTELTNLESVFLGVNKLNGTIPSDIGKLKRLKAFAVYYNQLTGTIPSSLTSSTDLTKLFLDENKLTGSIPPSIGSLAKLEDLRLCGNDLTGTLPPSMTAFESLQVLYLDRNKFGGEIMDYIVSGWFKMEKLDAWSNQFTGTINNQFGRLPYLISLNLHDNNFDSFIPENICDSGSLQKLDLSWNSLRGPVPQMLSRCPNLKQLVLNHNFLNGTIPSSLGTDSSNLVKLSLEHNDLQGDVPSELSRIPNLSLLNLQKNDLLECIGNNVCQNSLSICTDCGGNNQCSCCRCCNQCQ